VARLARHSRLVLTAANELGILRRFMGACALSRFKQHGAFAGAGRRNAEMAGQRIRVKTGRKLAVGPTLRTALALLLALTACEARAQSGGLDQIREEVRVARPSESASQPQSEVDHGHGGDHGSGSCHPDDSDGFKELYGKVFLIGVVAPFWIPHAALNDDFGTIYSFPPFPYDGHPGYMVLGNGYAADEEQDSSPRGLLDWFPQKRPWSVRWDLEYADNFDHVSHVGGHALVSTQWRFDLDVAASRFQEALAAGRTDDLWIGDANLVFRFAQNEFVQFRSGLGINWLGDNGRADVGFNFTYAIDVFPVKPWVFTTAIDWGTLGATGLFRFYGTAGIVVHGVEAYTGYEYLDVGTIHSHSLLAGLRFWF
jgi:hypothetical protein